VNLLADENIDRPIIDRLRKAGHQVLSVAEMAPGVTDDFIIELANKQKALLLTADKDFGEIVYRQKKLAPGVIFIRLAGLSPLEKAEVVFAAVNDHLHDVDQAFTVISRKSVRIRKNPLR
jgi:predicted nuclease of predicted toxin-antitoxin system